MCNFKYSQLRMKRVKCLVVDDEPLAVKLILNHIHKIDQLEVVATCNNAIKAFEILNTQEIDLLFLDIKMPNLTGIDFLKTLRNPPKTIFTTAYREYAIESYDLEAIDYLLKPITFERFFKAVNRFLQITTSSTKETKVQLPKDDFIMIKSGNKHHKVQLSAIIYIESIKDYIKIHLNNDTRITAKYKIGDIARDLEEKSFLRVHRSYLINTNKITAFTAHDLELAEHQIPIGVSYKNEVNTFLESLGN